MIWSRVRDEARPGGQALEDAELGAGQRHLAPVRRHRVLVDVDGHAAGREAEHVAPLGPVLWPLRARRNTFLTRAMSTRGLNGFVT